MSTLTTIFDRDDALNVALTEAEAALQELRRDTPAPRPETVERTALCLRMAGIQLNKIAAHMPHAPQPTAP